MDEDEDDEDVVYGFHTCDYLQASPQSFVHKDKFKILLNKLTIIFTLYFSLYKTSLFCCYCKTRVLLQHDPAHSSWRAPDVAPFQDRTTNTRKLDL